MAEAHLAITTGWTLSQIRSQPAWFIERVALLSSKVILRDNRAAKKANRNAANSKPRGR